jgi:hypothetical protein
VRNGADGRHGVAARHGVGYGHQRDGTARTVRRDLPDGPILR